MNRPTWTEWTARDAVPVLPVPREDDDKYSRGVVGVIAGSDRYPGAAVLVVEAAARGGAGMVRYVGPDRPTALVLARRPEVVPGTGRVQAWVVGSGMDAGERPSSTEQAIGAAVEAGVPMVYDAGALDLVRAGSTAVITPHRGELVRLLSAQGEAVTDEEVREDPEGWAFRGAELLGVTVLLKGAVTRIVSPGGRGLVVRGAPAWLATAGAGDVLAGLLGTLCATGGARAGAPDDLVPVAATAALVHGRAATLASGGGPIVALDVAEALPATIAALLGG